MKKMLALILAAVMLLSLAACGRADKSGKDVKTAEDDDEVYNGELPFVKEGDEPITITIGVHRLANVTDYKNNAFTKWLEDQTGLNIEFMLFDGTTAEAATKVSLMTASGEKLPDILHPGGISKVQADEYGAQGYFLDLVPYFEKYGYYQTLSFREMFPNDPNVQEQVMSLAVEPTSGQQFIFPFVEDVPLDAPICHAWINQEWLDKLELKAPTTLTELREVLIAFRDGDPNGNGKKDEIPMIGLADSAYIDILRPLINAYVYWIPMYTFNADENGKLWIPFNTDEYRQALIYINGLVSDGLLSPLVWTQTSEELKSLFNPTDGEYRCGIITGNAGLCFTPNSPSVYVYEPLAPFAGETPLGGYAPCMGYNIRLNTFISAESDHPIEAFKLLDFMSSPEASLWGRWGEKGVNWDYSDGTKPGNLGGTARIKLIGDAVYTTQNSQNWHNTWTVFSDYYSEYEVNTDDPNDWDTVRARKMLENYQNYIKAGEPEHRVFDLNYSKEANERLTEIAGELNSFIKTRRAQFCSGELDPRDDAQWQEYLDGLKMLHVDEWIELAQEAFDRQQKK